MGWDIAFQDKVRKRNQERLKQKPETTAEEAETELLAHSPEILSILWQVKHIFVVSINRDIPSPCKEGRGIHQ